MEKIDGIEKYKGRKIAAVEHLTDVYSGYVQLTFEDGTQIRIQDDWQSGNELRYITCDDDWNTLVGGHLLDVKSKCVAPIDGDYDRVHEQVFVDILTDKGFVTFTTHNEHNGYYDGFGLTILEEKEPEPELVDAVRLDWAKHQVRRAALHIQNGHHGSFANAIEIGEKIANLLGDEAQSHADDESVVFQHSVQKPKKWLAVTPERSTKANT